jgi:hypothetical protein
LREQKVEGLAKWSLFQQHLRPGQLRKPFERYITFLDHNIYHHRCTSVIIHNLISLSTLGAIKPTRISDTVVNIKQAMAHIQPSANGTFNAFTIQELETTLLLGYCNHA